ncbi:uncharacterized protein A4U43_C10F15190 [Asparagus officinalis]|uniref:Uncharacterized protein n=1 Tax=Asparagus officinalis TaxID=4686 RepID=A0A5P1E365_ASPOF|nr:uncharacterized protein A4U43_C10F15190 [Asparagus officinalis]
MKRGGEQGWACRLAARGGAAGFIWVLRIAERGRTFSQGRGAGGEASCRTGFGRRRTRDVGVVLRGWVPRQLDILAQLCVDGGVREPTAGGIFPSCIEGDEAGGVPVGARWADAARIRPRETHDGIIAVDDLAGADLHSLSFCTGPLMEQQQGGYDDGDGGDLFKRDKSSHLEWLDSKEERSVVYISFGSLLMLSEVQLEEVWEGLVRKDTRGKHLLQQSSEVAGPGPLLQGGKEGGMVVEWCD